MPPRDKAGIKPRRSESRSKLDSQFGRDPCSSKEPDHGAVHKASKGTCSQDQGKLAYEAFHESHLIHKGWPVYTTESKLSQCDFVAGTNP